MNDRVISDYCLLSSSSISDALVQINRLASQFILVVDNQNHLRGIVTDGDIRRCLINEGKLTCTLDKVMNSSPLTCNDTAIASKAYQIMLDKGVNVLPAVNPSGKICYLWLMRELASRSRIDNTVVIMAGGLGSRLGELTQNTPKPMLTINEKPILEIILSSFIKYGFHNFYFCVNYKSEVIEDYFRDGNAFNCSITYIHENKRLGTAGALSLLPKFDKPFIVSNADVICNVNYRHVLLQHLKEQCDATMVSKKVSVQIPYGVLDINSQGYLNTIEEKPQKEYLISGGINVLSPSVLKYVPQEQFFDMPDLLKTITCNSGKVFNFLSEDYWIDVGQVNDLNRAKSDYSDHLFL